MDFIKNYFKLEEKGSTIRKEFVAGLTTFLAMAYILFVNPLVLSDAGMNKDAVFTATAIAAIVGTLVMGIYANYPVALAPGMGMNALFAYTIASPMFYDFTWQEALAAVLVSGVVFLILSFSGVREKVINAIPQDLKYAVGAGIGLFIAFIGLKNAGIVSYIGLTGDPADVVPVLGDLSNPLVLLAIIGLVITVILYVLRVPAAVFLGIVLTAIVGICWRLILESGGNVLSDALDMGLPQVPKEIISTPAAPEFGAFIKGFGSYDWGSFEQIFTFFVVVFTLLFLDFFDTAGTLVSVGERAGLLDEEGQLVDSGKALAADATATVVGAVVGTSSTTSYVESLSGIEVGGRTGLTAVFVSIFFIIALFFSPLLTLVTSSVTAPALIFVGILMASQLSKVKWNDIAIAIPTFITLIIMPLAYSIATGIAVGFIFYPISMICAKRHKEVSPTMYILSLVFLAYFIITTIW